MAGEANRRELLAGAVAAVGVAGLIDAVPALAAPPAPAGDAAVLSQTFAIERVVEISYRTVLATGALKPGVRAALRRILSQERTHLALLGRALRALDTPLPLVDADSARRLLGAHHIDAGLSQLRTQHECLRLLVDVESLVEGAYFSAISQLNDPDLIRTCVGAMGCEAQHWTLLSATQHHDQVKHSVPYPFVQGSP
jgi:Ferritin-like domain